MRDQAHVDKVAIIGGSLAGLGAALDLALAGVEVTVYERESRVLPDFEPPTLGASAALLGLARRLGLKSVGRADDSGVIDSRRASVKVGGDRGELVRFRNETGSLASDFSWVGATVGSYLRQQQHSEEFVRTWFLPRALAWAGGELGAVEDASLESLSRAWLASGIVGHGREPTRIDGGVDALRPRLVEAIEAAGGVIRPRTHVRMVRRTPTGVRVHAVQWGAGPGAAVRVESADAVIIALNPDPAGRLLADADREEASLLGDIPTRICRVVRHTDHRLMPKDRADWRAIQYLMTDADEDSAPPSRTRWLNRTGERPLSAKYTFESWDPFLEPAADRIESDELRTVPRPSAAGDSARRALIARQGRRRTWYVGAWLRCPFTAEDALRTGMNAAGQILEQRYIAPTPLPYGSIPMEAMRDSSTSDVTAVGRRVGR